MGLQIIIMFGSLLFGIGGLFLVYKHILNQLDETKERWENIKAQQLRKLEEINKVIT